MVMGGNVSRDVFDNETGELTRGEKVAIEFAVTAELLAEARELTNALGRLSRQNNRGAHCRTSKEYIKRFRKEDTH
jgi:hypothetical protein